MLVEREADEQRHRVGCDQRVRLVGVGEVQAIGQLDECYPWPDDLAGNELEDRDHPPGFAGPLAVVGVLGEDAVG